MAKNNNKGFSLIEIVIAMAVLTLLLTPIIKQFAQTMKVSRQAKEQQYINEEASYSLEEGQTTPQKDYEEKYVDLAAADAKLEFATSTDVVQCVLVDSTGAAIILADESGSTITDDAGNSVNYVEYTVDTFTLSNMEIGPDKSVYNRIMTVDNLATQIRGYKNAVTGEGLSIKYNMTKDEIPPNYTLTNEGSAVELDANGNVKGIVVEDSTYVGNPNDTNLGNMQNLDYETVAMINGTATNFDEQAEKALFSMAMDSLKEINYEEWELGMLHSSGDNILLQHGYAPTMRKLTKIYAEQLTDSENKDYYLIKADVYYNCSYTLDGQDSTAELTYNVFSQKFYTEECPAIYFEYQPFVTEMVDLGNGSYDVTYAENDFILIDNYVEDAKLYLYKPYRDAINVSTGIDESSYTKKDSYTYTTVAPSADDLASEAAYEQFLLDNSVGIYVANANANVEKMTIYTNLNTEDNGSQSQFFVRSVVFSQFSELFVTSEKEIYKSSPRTDFDRSLIKPLSEDTRYDDRLRTVTITLLPVETDSAGNVIYSGGKAVVRDDANTVILTGPKGEK